MDKVLVFTNEEKWENLQDDIQERVNWSVYPNENQPVMECVAHTGNDVELCPVMELDHDGIFLVYDNINMEYMESLIGGCKEDNVFVLIHTRGCKMEDFSQWRDFCFIRKGKHVNFPNELYLPVFDIITDAECNKLERIIKSVFMPYEEAATGLLNDCLYPQCNLGTSVAYNKLLRLERSAAYSSLYQAKCITKRLEDFKKKYESSVDFEEYKDNLKWLRELLLGSFL